MSKFAGKNILIIDDEDMICQFLTEVFVEHGATVTSAADGVDAMLLLSQMNFDLVITDYRMPYANGMDVAKAAIKQKNPPRVVICSGFAAELNPSELSAMKEITVINKPFEVQEFLSKIAAMF
jgi:DNA-binding response OmpR family regulator